MSGHEHAFICPTTNRVRPIDLVWYGYENLHQTNFHRCTSGKTTNKNMKDSNTQSYLKCNINQCINLQFCFSLKFVFVFHCTAPVYWSSKPQKMLEPMDR